MRKFEAELRGHDHFDRICIVFSNLHAASEATCIFMDSEKLLWPSHNALLLIGYFVCGHVGC